MRRRRPEVPDPIGPRTGPVIHVMELLKSEGKNGLAKVLDKGNPGTQACEMWLLKHGRK